MRLQTVLMFTIFNVGVGYSSYFLIPVSCVRELSKRLFFHGGNDTRGET